MLIQNEKDARSLNSAQVSNKTQIFKNDKFGAIRTIDVDGEIYFVGNDVAKALGYTDPKNAVTQYCNGASKRCPIPDYGAAKRSPIPDRRWGAFQPTQ